MSSSKMSNGREIFAGLIALAALQVAAVSALNGCELVHQDEYRFTKFVWIISSDRTFTEKSQCPQYREKVLEVARETKMFEPKSGSSARSQYIQVVRLTNEAAICLFGEIWKKPLGPNFKKILDYLDLCVEHDASLTGTEPPAEALAEECESGVQKSAEITQLLRAISEEHHKWRRSEADGKSCSVFNEKVLETARATQLLKRPDAPEDELLEQVVGLIKVRAQCMNIKSKDWARGAGYKSLIVFMNNCIKLIYQ